MTCSQYRLSHLIALRLGFAPAIHLVSDSDSVTWQSSAGERRSVAVCRGCLVVASVATSFDIREPLLLNSIKTLENVVLGWTENVALGWIEKDCRQDREFF